MENEAYLSALGSDAAALAAAARLGPAVAVPSCPGWIVANLLIHLGTVHRGWVSVIEAHGTEWPLDIRRRLLEQTFPGLIELFQRGEKGVTAWFIPEGLIEWFEEGAAELEEVLRRTNLDDSVWQPPGWPWHREQTVRLFLQAANIETAIHRWDAQLAHQCTTAIDHVVAEAGIDQALREMTMMNRWYVREFRKAPAPPGKGETYRFQQTDSTGTWFVRFEGENVVVENQAAEADVTIRASASDLLLFLWHRIPADHLDVTGDATLLDRYFELAPAL